MLKTLGLGFFRGLYRFGVSPALDLLAWAHRSWLATCGLALLVTFGSAYLALMVMAHNAYAGWAEPDADNARVEHARIDPAPALPATIDEFPARGPATSDTPSTDAVDTDSASGKPPR